MSPILAAIDIGSNTVRVVTGEIRDDKIVLLARASAQSAGVRNGYITNKTDAAVAIKKALRLTEKQIGQEINEIYATVGGGPLSACVHSSSVAVSHGDGLVTQADIENATRRSTHKSLSSNQRTIYQIDLKYKLDGEETVSEPLGMKGKKLEVSTMLFNYASQNMDAIEDVLDSLGASVTDFFPGIIASGVVSLSVINRKVGCVLIDIGSDTTSFIIYEQDNPVYVGQLETGSDAVTQALALEYQIPVTQAELIKQGGPLPLTLDRKKVDVVIAKALTGIFKQISSQLKAIGKQANLPGGAIVCGGGSLDKQIEDIARQVLKIPSSRAVVQAFRREGDERELAWAGVYGTVIRALNEERTGRRHPLTRAFQASWAQVKKYFV